MEERKDYVSSNNIRTLTLLLRKVESVTIIILYNVKNVIKPGPHLRHNDITITT